MALASSDNTLAPEAEAQPEQRVISPGQAPGQFLTVPFSACIPAGRLIELSGGRAGARYRSAVSLLRQAQGAGETVAWVGMEPTLIYPPDWHDAGVALESVVMVRIPPSAGGYGVPKAAELLLRSGGFGFVVLDLTQANLKQHDQAWQGRLLGLAREHEAKVVLLTKRTEQQPSLGPLVSLRSAPKRRRVAENIFEIEHDILKSKLGPQEIQLERTRGPWGLK